MTSKKDERRRKAPNINRGIDRSGEIDSEGNLEDDDSVSNESVRVFDVVFGARSFDDVFYEGRNQQPAILFYLPTWVSLRLSRGPFYLLPKELQNRYVRDLIME